jgi:hypothetical protein
MKFVKGRPVPFSEIEKVQFAVTNAVTVQNPFPDCACWASDIRHDQFRSMPIDGDSPNVNRPQNQRIGERVEASGKCVIRRRRLEDSRMLMPVTVNYEVVAESKFDEWGLPDFKITSFTTQAE